MSVLEKYNPLKTIWIPGAEIAEPQGIIVVVGPNSSGKTLFLRDIENYLLTGTQTFVVCEAIASQRPSRFQGFVDELIAKHYIQRHSQNPRMFTTRVSFITASEPRKQQQQKQFDLQDLEKAYNAFVPMERGNTNPEWFGSIGLTLVAPLTLDQRRAVCESVASFKHQEATPNLPLQGLQLNTDAQDRLAEETRNVFGNVLWLDISQTGVLQLRVSGSRMAPTPGELINPTRAGTYRRIEEEGDGYQSYVGICLSLLLAIRPVSLIDEPELCLHPPQAYHIGRFIGRYATADHVTFVATHSSHVLRGILETGRKVTVVRMTKRGKSFSGKRIADKELIDSVRNPRTRAETILDGIFSKGVVLVESEGDREEYQAASEAIDDFPAREVHFAPVGGNGGFAEPLRFYRSLDIPVAIITDLDTVVDVDKLAILVKLLTRPGADTQQLITDVRELVTQIKSLPPPISEVDAKERLKELSEESWSWTKGDDSSLRRKLSELDGKLKRIQKLKEGGIDAYGDHSELKSRLQKIVERFASIGLFFVPIGELEDWIKPLMADVPKGSKSKTDRAAIAADRIREATTKDGDIWAFVKGVLDYIREPEVAA